MHRTTKRFWSCLDSLPKIIQKTARKNFNLLKTNPKHPSLHLKRVGTYWSARIGVNYRAIAVRDDDDDDLIWVWIGTHKEYERLIK